MIFYCRWYCMQILRLRTYLLGESKEGVILPTINHNPATSDIAFKLMGKIKEIRFTDSSQVINFPGDLKSSLTFLTFH